MNKFIYYDFNIDTAWVELRFTEGSMVSIECTAVENGIVKNISQSSELDWFVYNDQTGYACLILNGNLAEYLKAVTDYKRQD